jgi:hypothetical protein
LNQPTKILKSSFLPFAFPAVPRLYTELSTVTVRVPTQT